MSERVLCIHSVFSTFDHTILVLPIGIFIYNHGPTQKKSGYQRRQDLKHAALQEAAKTTPSIYGFFKQGKFERM